VIDAKWEAMNEQAKAKTSLVQIKMDNGLENRGRYAQCWYRMTQFADTLHQPIQLL
jgi:hypothetical protein